MHKYKSERDKEGPNTIHDNTQQSAQPRMQAEPVYRPRHSKWPTVFAAGAVVFAVYEMGVHHNHVGKIMQQIGRTWQQLPQNEETHHIQHGHRQVHETVVTRRIIEEKPVYVVRHVAPSPQQNWQQMQYKLQKMRLHEQAVRDNMNFQLRQEQMRDNMAIQQRQMALQEYNSANQWQIQRMNQARQNAYVWMNAARNFTYSYRR